MTVTVQTIASTGTPATTAYNLLRDAMLANGHWTETSDSPITALQAQTTAPCRIWKCDDGLDFFIAIEVDDTNQRIRIRAAELHQTSDHQISQPATHSSSASGSSSTSFSPTVNSSADDSFNPWGGGVIVSSFSNLSTPTNSFFFLYEVRDNMLIAASRPSSNLNYYCVVGHFQSLVTFTADLHPLILLDHPIQGKCGSGFTQSASAALYGVVSRSPGITSSTVGAMCVEVDGIHNPTVQQGATGPALDDGLGGISPNTQNVLYHSGAIATQAMIHGCGSNFLAPDRMYRGYLPDMLVVTLDALSPAEPLLGDTITVDGVVYYFLGPCAAISSGVLVSNKTGVLAVKA